MKEIKRLTIKVEKGGMRCLKLGELTKQSLTIKNNGQVWWTAFRNFTWEEVAKGFAIDRNIVDKVRVSEYKNIGKENAKKILEKAQEILPKHVDTEWEYLVDDAILDAIFIEYENGEFLVGQLALPYELDDVEDFYDYLAEELLIEQLF